MIIPFLKLLNYVVNRFKNKVRYSKKTEVIIILVDCIHFSNAILKRFLKHDE